MVKLSSSGSIQWQQSFGGSSDDYGGFICQTTDSGYILAGNNFSNDGDVSGNHGQNDYWIAKLSATGSIQWQKCLGGSLGDAVSSIQQTSDGGYIVAGTTESNNGDVSGNHGNEDYWVVKLSVTGSIVWQKCYGGSHNDNANSIRQTVDGGYIVIGGTNSNNGDVSGFHGGLFDYWIVKLSASGSIEWQKCYGGGDDDEAYFVNQTSDGGYVVVGASKSINGNIIGNHGLNDCWIIKLSVSGSLEWQRPLGSSGGDGGSYVQETTDGGYMVGGYSSSNDGDVSGVHGYSDMWIAKLSSSGSIQWQKCLGSTGGESIRSIYSTSDDGYILAGYTNGNDGDVSGYHGGQDIWVVKLGAKTAVEDVGNMHAISISPNPVADIISIQGVEKPAIRLYSISGQLIKEARHTNTISISGCPPGMYFIYLYDTIGSLIYHGKVVKL